MATYSSAEVIQILVSAWEPLSGRPYSRRDLETAALKKGVTVTIESRRRFATRPGYTVSATLESAGGRGYANFTIPGGLGDVVEEVRQMLTFSRRVEGETATVEYQRFQLKRALRLALTSYVESLYDEPKPFRAAALVAVEEVEEKLGIQVPATELLRR